MGDRYGTEDDAYSRDGRYDRSRYSSRSRDGGAYGASGAYGSDRRGSGAYSSSSSGSARSSYGGSGSYGSAGSRGMRSADSYDDGSYGAGSRSRSTTPRRRVSMHDDDYTLSARSSSRTAQSASTRSRSRTTADRYSRSSHDSAQPYGSRSSYDAGERYSRDGATTRSSSRGSSRDDDSFRSSLRATSRDGASRRSSRLAPDGSDSTSASATRRTANRRSVASDAAEGASRSNRLATRASARSAAASTRTFSTSSTARTARANRTAGAAAASGRPRMFRIVAIAVAVAAVIAIIAAVSYVRSITSNLHEGVDDDLRAALVQTNMSKEPFYMLLLGVDRAAWREGTEDGGLYHSDSMMLARIDAPNGKITLVSIPRDTLVDMGEYGWQKINVAYGLGGPALAVEEVSKLMGVNISHYAEVDIDGLMVVVQALGGIEVEVPIEIDDVDAGGYVPAGWQTLDGGQVLILVRAREAYANISPEPDAMRAANQRMVLSAIAHKLLSADVATIANVVRDVSGYVTTDLELNDIIGLAQAMQGLDTSDDFYTASLPSHSAYIANGTAYADFTFSEVLQKVDSTILEGWYVIMEEDEWKKMKERLDQGLPPSEGLVVDEATGTVLATAGADAEDLTDKSCWISLMNGTSREGLGTRALGILNAAGYENVTLVDAPDGYDYSRTLVVYDQAERAYEAKRLAQTLGQGEAFLNDGSWYVDNHYLVVVGEDWNNTAATGIEGSAGSTGSASVGAE